MNVRSLLYILFTPVFIVFGFFSIYGDTIVSETNYEQLLINSGLVDIQTLDTTIKVKLKYACAQNFMGEAVYGNLKRCFLQRKAADKLLLANNYLKMHYPNLSLLIVDGFRPRHIQTKMWGLVKGTPMQRYVANPQFGSMHNYGCAVDITLTDEFGKALDMGTPIDSFSSLSQPLFEMSFLRKGLLSEEQIKNRKILREVMVAAGFNPINIEWWHFDAFNKNEVRKNYSIIE